MAVTPAETTDEPAGETVTCPLCREYSGEQPSVEAHISSKTDDLHKGYTGKEVRGDIQRPGDLPPRSELSDSKNVDESKDDLEGGRGELSDTKNVDESKSESKGDPEPETDGGTPEKVEKGLPDGSSEDHDTEETADIDEEMADEIDEADDQDELDEDDGDQEERHELDPVDDYADPEAASGGSGAPTGTMMIAAVALFAITVFLRSRSGGSDGDDDEDDAPASDTEQSGDLPPEMERGVVG
jgi:hypothetical protein